MQTVNTSMSRQPVACILLPAGKSTECFFIRDIVRLEARSNYTYVHFINRRPLLVAKVMRLLEAFLQPYGFIRIHRRYVINSSFVIGIDDGNIILHDQSLIPVSRRRKKEVTTIWRHDKRSSGNSKFVAA